MNLEIFEKLRGKFENKNFEKDYYYIERTLFVSSLFGNLLSIIFAFFFVNSIVKNAAVHFPGQQYILPLFIVVFLTMFELLKRFTFANITYTYFTAKRLTTKFLIGAMFATVLISGSFYLALNGAQRYVSKADQITLNTDSIIVQNTNDLNLQYNAEISKAEDKINYVYSAANSRKRKSLTTEEIVVVKSWENDIKELKKERDSKIENVKQEVLSKTDKKLETNNESQIAFILLFAFVELLILIGVGFHAYYTFSSFTETKEKLDANPNYKKLGEYSELLQVLFNNGKLTVNDELPGANRFRELVGAKIKIKPSQRAVKEFLALTNHLNITYSHNSTRRAKVAYTEAKDILLNYLSLNE